MAVLSSGDELVESETSRLGPGQIRDANRSMLLAAIRASNSAPVDLGIAEDTQEDVERRFQEAIDQEADVLITTGNLETRQSCQYRAERDCTAFENSN